MFTDWFRPAGTRARGTARAPEQKGLSAPLIALSLAGRPSWSRRDFATLAREGVMANAIAYRAVRLVAEASASVPWLLYEGDIEADARHPLLRLLAAPNGAESGSALFERWYAFLQCAGNSYLQALSAGGEVRELHVLRPDRVSVVQDAGGRPLGYDYSVGGATARIVRDANGFLPVLHGRLFHPLSDCHGLSPLEPAAFAVDIHNAGAGWTKSLLDNAARPSGALVYKGPDNAPGLTEEQFGRLKRELEDAYQGAANAGRPMVLEGGLDWRAMSYAPSEMDFSAMRNAAAREIALAFGLPPMLLGLPGDNTYANYREANLAFWRQTVLPLVARTAADLTRWLAPRFGDNLRLGFDADAIPALAEDRQGVWDKLNAADFLTREEKRMAAGYSPDGVDSLSPTHVGQRAG
ncbi:MAG TPA: phage portal protein [Rhizomicrobium sp.]|nr:phage portal protein [Rhizomicrobium sp.]